MALLSKCAVTEKLKSKTSKKKKKKKKEMLYYNVIHVRNAYSHKWFKV